MKERNEGDPYFSWKDYIFGNNIGAATLQIIIGFVPHSPSKSLISLS